MDNGISAWQRNRKRDGWDELIAAAKRGEISHIVCYHPDRLMRQPHDLEELLTISDQHGITLYGRVNRRDLRDPDDRYALRIEVAHACRSSDDTSRRVRDEIADRAEKGMPHTTKRRYGYSRNGMVVNDAEAEVIREIFGRFTAGEGPRTIAAVLDGRGITTAQGKRWTAVAVRDQLRSKYVAGIRVHRGKETGRGVWRAIIERGVWDLAREMLDFRAARAAEQRGSQRFYVLRDLVACGKCGTRMPGTNGRYQCTHAQRGKPKRCGRSVTAGPLEQFVEDAAVDLLARLAVDGRPGRSAEAEAAEAAIADDERQLKELDGMWTAKEIPTATYRQMRREITARIARNEPKTIARPVETRQGLTGPNAATTGAELSGQRKNAVLRFLFAARHHRRTGRRGQPVRLRPDRDRAKPPHVTAPKQRSGDPPQGSPPAYVHSFRMPSPPGASSRARWRADSALIVVLNVAQTRFRWNAHSASWCVFRRKAVTSSVEPVRAVVAVGPHPLPG